VLVSVGAPVAWAAEEVATLVGGTVHSIGRGWEVAVTYPDLIPGEAFSQRHRADRLG